MDQLQTIKTEIWLHKKIRKCPISLQVAADKCAVRLPITQIHEAEKLLKHLNKGKRKPTAVSDQAFKRYRDAKYSHQSAHFPGWVSDGHFIEPERPSIGSAGDLQNFIQDFLTWSGHFANRTGNEGRVIIDKTGKPKRIPSSSKNGMQDIDTNLTHSQHKFGIPWKIEVKFGKDTHKDHQKDFGATVQKTGGVYSVVRNVEDFLQQYNKLMIGDVKQIGIFDNDSFS